MGDLYLAHDPNTNRLVALKLLNATLDSTELRERFAREARALAALNHPNIVNIYDTGEYDDAPFIVMEYVRGETLAEIIKRRAPMSVSQKLKLMTELCAGLAQAHNANIIHRDIKPANLMVDQQGRLKILDFGIARVAEDNRTRFGPLTAVNMMIGTPGLHVARAARSRRGRSPQRHFRRRRRLLRAALEHRSVRGLRHAHGRAPGSDRQADAARDARARHRSGNRRDHPARAEEGTQQALSGRRHIREGAGARARPHGPRRRSGTASADPRRSPHRASEASRAPAGQRRRISARWRPLEPAPATPRSVSRSKRSRKIRRTREREPSSRASSTGRRPPRRPRRRARRHLRPERRRSGPCWARRRPTRGRRWEVGARRSASEARWAAAGEPLVGGGTMAGSGSTSVGSGRTSAGDGRTSVGEMGGTLGGRTAVGSSDSDATSTFASAPTIIVAPSKPKPQPAQNQFQALWGARKAAAPAKPPAREAKAYAREAPPNKGNAPAAATQQRIGTTGGAAVGAVSIGRAGRWHRARASRSSPRSCWFIGRGPAGQLLTITKPEGGTLSAAGIRCGTRGNDCSATRPNGDAIELTPQADAGYTFVGYTGDCAPGGRTIMSSSRTCGATFTKDVAPATAAGATQTLTIAPVPTGGTLEGVDILCGTKGSVCSAQSSRRRDRSTCIR